MEDTPVKVEQNPARLATKSAVKKATKPAYEKSPDDRIVKGMFKSYETPGATIKFCYAKGKQEVKFYTMTDGQIYDVALSVAKHLNTDCWYPVHRYLQDENGNMVQRVGQKVQRYGFQPLDFTDVGTPPSNILTVENL